MIKYNGRPASCQSPHSQPVKAHHLEHLRASGIADDVIRERGYRSTDGGAELLELGFSREQARLSGLLIPIYSPLGGILSGSSGLMSRVEKSKATRSRFASMSWLRFLRTDSTLTHAFSPS
jgi:hypothetical protein